MSTNCCSVSGAPEKSSFSNTLTAGSISTCSLRASNSCIPGRQRVNNLLVNNLTVRDEAIFESGCPCALADTLVTGNVTGGTDIAITSGDSITGSGQVPIISSQAAVDAVAITASDAAGGVTITSGTVSSAFAPIVNGIASASTVTASGNSGVITTAALTTALNVSTSVTWTNTFISATSIILLTVVDTDAAPSGAGQLLPWIDARTGGSAVLVLANVGGASLAGTFQIAYLILRGI